MRALLVVAVATVIASGPGVIAQGDPNVLSNCGLLTFNSTAGLDLTGNAGYFATPTIYRGNFQRSSESRISVLPKDSRGGYILFQRNTGSLTHVLGASARYVVGTLPRVGPSPCKVSFFYRLAGFSRLTLYSQVEGNVTLLWTATASILTVWTQAFVSLPGNSVDSVQLYFEGVIGIDLAGIDPHVAIDDFDYPSECCGIQSGCTSGLFQCSTDLLTTCLLPNQVCDGIMQCPDNRDEFGCTPPTQALPPSCASACSPGLDQLTEAQLSSAQVSRGPAWTYFTEDGRPNTPGSIVNSTFLFRTGYLLVQWQGGSNFFLYPLADQRDLLCLAFPLEVCGQTVATAGPIITGTGTSPAQADNRYDLCAEPAYFDNFMSAAVLRQLQGTTDDFDWDLTNRGQAFPGEPPADVSGTGGYLIARTDAGGGVMRLFGTRASFYSPPFPGPNGTCSFTFNYIIVGRNRLSIYIVLQAGRVRLGGPLFTTTNSTSPSLSFARRTVTFTTMETDVQIEFEAISGGEGYVAVDNFVFPWACCGLSTCQGPTYYSCQDNVTLSPTGARMTVTSPEQCINSSDVCSTPRIQQCNTNLDQMGCYTPTLAQVCKSSLVLATCSKSQVMSIMQRRLPLTVTRGSDWQYVDEDGNAGSRGTIQSLNNFNATQYVLVHWDSSPILRRFGIYRMGADNKFDVCLDSSLPPILNCSEPTAEPPTAGTAPTFQPSTPDGPSVDTSLYNLCRTTTSLDMMNISDYAGGQSQTDSFDWELVNPGDARNPTDPAMDVSGLGGYLISRSFCGTGCSRRLGTTASLFTPSFAGPQGTCTFTFHYNLAGVHRLRVFLTASNVTRLGGPVFSTVTSTGSLWVQRQVTINTLLPGVRLEFEAVMGSFGGYVALDALVLPWACCGLSSCVNRQEYSCQDNVTVTSTGMRLTSPMNETCILASNVCNGAQQCRTGLDERGCYNTNPSALPAVCSRDNPGDNCTTFDILRIIQSRLPVNVVRGAGWEYDNEDRTSGFVSGGVIRDLDNFFDTEWVRVYWNSGTSGLYRMGAEGKLDLCINYPSVPPVSCDDFRNTSSSTPMSQPTASATTNVVGGTTFAGFTDVPTAGVPTSTSTGSAQCVSPVQYDQWLSDIAEWRRLFNAWRQETSSNFCQSLTTTSSSSTSSSSSSYSPSTTQYPTPDPTTKPIFP